MCRAFNDGGADDDYGGDSFKQNLVLAKFLMMGYPTHTMMTILRISPWDVLAQDICPVWFLMSNDDPPVQKTALSPFTIRSSGKSHSQAGLANGFRPDKPSCFNIICIHMSLTKKRDSPHSETSLYTHRTWCTKFRDMEYQFKNQF